MPMFLPREKIYRLLQRELPEDVYPDGAPTAYYHTADMDSVAQAVSGAYSSLERVWVNKFPTEAEEEASAWELTIMGDNLPSTATLEERKNRYLQRLRSPRGISKARLEGVVRSVLGEDTDFLIIEYNDRRSGNGTWVLGVSELGVSTYLANRSGLDLPKSESINCDYLTTAPPGYTLQEWQDYRWWVYTYEVRIFNRVLTATEETDLDKALTAAEPARSGHKIVDNATEFMRPGGA